MHIVIVFLETFFMGLLSNGGRERNNIWHKGSLGGEDDTWTSNTCTAQRKHAIPHSTMKTHRNMWRLF